MGKLLRLERTPPVGEGEGGASFEGRSDEALMAMARVGSQAAFRTLVARHAAKVASFCARISGDPAGAHEVAQDVWLALWDGRSRWEPRGRFSSYLYTIAFTRARNHARSRRRRAALFSAEPLPSDIAKPGAEDEIERLLERERRERVWDALSELPDAMREAVVLRFVEELPYEQMETILRTNGSTLRSRVHHALAQLKNRLAKEGRP